MTEATRLTLISAEATNVLGEYDHQFVLPENEDFLIIYGPNGVGKTRFLEIIHALLRLDGRTLGRMPFDRATLRFSDGSALSVGGHDAATQDGIGRLLTKPVRFRLDQPGAKAREWQYVGGDFEEWLQEHTTWRAFDQNGMWQDRADGEQMTISELEERFAHRTKGMRVMPEQFRQFREQVSSYLIETQRLRIEAARPIAAASATAAGYRTGQRRRPLTKISEHADKMRSLVNDAQTEHSTITQQLDRDFPGRVLAMTEKPADEMAVRQRYEEQNAFRSRIGQIASVDLDDALSLPGRALREWEVRLLTLYVDDAERKLAPFDKLLQKIELLEEIVNSRLLRKRLHVTAKDGLSVRHELDDRRIALNSLSSGEQHEIILMFDLLFNVKEGALVMIDEPEISLHVVWQMAFIPDVQKIAELAGFRFVVATHSPQIINNNWDRAVPLGPEEVPFQ